MSGKRILVPMSGQLKPAGSFGPPPLMYPRRAWLEGSVLTVESAADVRQCDLVTASKIRLRWVPTFMRSWCLVLYAWPEPRRRPVRLVLHGLDGILLSADDLRLLAQIIGSRPAAAGRRTQRILRCLHDVAAMQDRRTKPIDWSFRTAPQGHNRPTS